LGSSIDDFLREENIFEEAQAQAIKEVVAWELAKAMKKKKIPRRAWAVLLKTSRSQVDRILDRKRHHAVELAAGAALVGGRWRLSWFDGAAALHPCTRTTILGLLARSGGSLAPLCELF